MRARLCEDMIMTIVGNGSSLYGGDGGDSSLASLVAPEAIALDDTGDLYIATVGRGPA